LAQAQHNQNTEHSTSIFSCSFPSKVMWRWLAAVTLKALLISANWCDQRNVDMGMHPDLHILDETSMLQTMSRNIPVQPRTTKENPTSRTSTRSTRATTDRNMTVNAVQSKGRKGSHKGTGWPHKILKLHAPGLPASHELLLKSVPAGKRNVRKGWSGAKRMHNTLMRKPVEQIERISDDEIDITKYTGMKIVEAMLLIAFLVFLVLSFSDIRKFWLLIKLDRGEDALADSGRIAGVQTKAEEPYTWSATMLVGLNAYRFYTGFLTATWLPYLLAMEGQYLWSEDQSMFMGCAKLIYGATILSNPILGLAGDRAILLSYGIGRRLFVRIGVALAALGVVICMIAAYIQYFYTFMFGIFVWRVGEAINDVTTETLAPELVAPEQFQFASAIKAALFLFGGLFGYILIVLTAGIHYNWLYYAYLTQMIITCIPVLLLLDDDAPRLPRAGSRQQRINFGAEMAEAYLAPPRIEGGFPRACLAVFVFSLGTAPMFFLLLLVRDIVGIRNEVALQTHFGGSSIMFFLAAALAAAMSGTRPPKPGANLPAQQAASQDSESAGDSSLVKSIVRMTFSVSLCALMFTIFPWIALIVNVQPRLIAFYMIATLCGFGFGLSFSQFQGITWQLLPLGIDLANAMGFNVMSRLLGLGVGNFIAGIILDFFYVDIATASPGITDGGYSFTGYVFMCTASGMATLGAAILSYSIALKYRAAERRGLKLGNIDPAA